MDFVVSYFEELFDHSWNWQSTNYPASYYTNFFYVCYKYSEKNRNYQRSTIDRNNFRSLAKGRSPNADSLVIETDLNYRATDRGLVKDFTASPEFFPANFGLSQNIAR